MKLYFKSMLLALPKIFDTIVALASVMSLTKYALITSCNTQAAMEFNPEDIVLKEFENFLRMSKETKS